MAHGSYSVLYGPVWPMGHGKMSLNGVYEQPFEDNEFILDDLQSLVNEVDYLDTNTGDLIDLADPQSSGF